MPGGRVGLVWRVRVGTSAEHVQSGFEVLVCLSPGSRSNSAYTYFSISKLMFMRRQTRSYQSVTLRYTTAKGRWNSRTSSGRKLTCSNSLLRCSICSSNCARASTSAFRCASSFSLLARCRSSSCACAWHRFSTSSLWKVCSGALVSNRSLFALEMIVRLAFGKKR